MSKTQLKSPRILRLAVLMAAPAFWGVPGSPVRAQQKGQPVDTSEIQVLPVRGNIYMLSGAGCNITVSLGADGAFLVDSGVARMGDKVLAAIRQLAKTNRPVVRYIVNTSLDSDHTGANDKIAPAGFTVAGGIGDATLADAGEGAAIIAHENVLSRMSALAQPKLPFAALPTDTYYGADMKLSHFFNGEGIRIYHIPSAHTDGDSIVYFRGVDDVISAGDIFLTTSYPAIDVANGGNVQGVIQGLNQIIDIAIPFYRMEGGTMIIPGHGRLSDVADVAFYRDMVTIVRDRVEALIQKGYTLEQVKAAQPTQDYDLRYGTSSGAWTAGNFVEGVYRSLASAKSRAVSR
ncbi:MAG: MBL fold metallo-hydrolase [Acidobacteriota bacterium]|nr:MBL fold metallo-hydrolase [Acidobacteriota bacterium]